MKRREVLALAAAAAVSRTLSAYAQSGYIATVGVLWHAANADQELPYSTPIRKGFKDLGYAEGKSLRFEERYPAEQADRYAPLATELVALSPDALIAIGIPAALALQRATSTIPIVFVGVADPVGLNLVASLAHPGANVTGLSSIQFDLAAKRIEILKEAIPSVSRVAVLLNPSSPYELPRWMAVMQPVADRLRLSLETVEARTVDELNGAFPSMSKRFDAVIVVGSNLYALEKRRIAELALASKLPTMMPFDLYVEDGGLLSYSQPWASMFSHAAIYVDKILRGAKPGDLPVEQPTKIDLVLNLKTAKLLGIEFSPQVLTQADRIIE